ncbi:MAG: FHA domain-containing protein [Blastochloris sp.]|nr:FHA domain-containing protein [Blastochloris sp.]
MVEPNADRPILRVQGDKKRQITLPKDDVTLGRGDDCDVVLPERQVSRQHIRIYKENEMYFAQDLESKNGTWINGVKLTGTRRLFDGDEINLAYAVRMQFIDSNTTAPITADALLPVMMGGRLKIDPEARRVFIQNVEVDPPLSPPQYRLLELLYSSAGRICTRDSVVESVWPDAIGEGVSEQAIDALVRRLRDRLAEIDPDWQYIITVRGHGFRLSNPET